MIFYTNSLSSIEETTESEISDIEELDKSF